MDFSDALKALKEGKRIRRQSWPNRKYLLYGTNTIFIYKLDENSSNSGSYSITNVDLFSDDWEILPDIPKVKLFRSKDILFICPKCQSQQEHLVYVEDKADEIHECRFCGQKFTFSNLDEMKKMFYWSNSPKTNQLSDFISLSNIKTKEEAERIVDKLVSEFNNTNGYRMYFIQ